MSERPTYFDIQSRLAEANANFYRLDADIRAKHLNDPARWADAVVQATQEGDAAKLAELGLDATTKPKQKAPEPKTEATAPVTPKPPQEDKKPADGGD